jgi:hypothetical protein
LEGAWKNVTPIKWEKYQTSKRKLFTFDDADDDDDGECCESLLRKKKIMLDLRHTYTYSLCDYWDCIFCKGIPNCINKKCQERKFVVINIFDVIYILLKKRKKGQRFYQWERERAEEMGPEFVNSSAFLMTIRYKRGNLIFFGFFENFMISFLFVLLKTKHFFCIQFSYKCNFIGFWVNLFLS